MADTKHHTDLAAVAHALRSLHRALAERVRRDAEAERRTLIQPGAWLSMLTSDAQFAWLRSLSELIVDLDVFLEADPAPAEDDLSAIRAEIERLIAPSSVESVETEFARHYWHYVHDEPQVAIAHGEIRQAIDRLPKATDVDEGAALHARHRWAETRRHRG
ncbi:MAG TPA: hypothetical protein VJ891_04240 [Casimicrobiaceae bacterium]|nr:hypothetical protein [Casimicrobiaceae bacterium]